MAQLGDRGSCWAVLLLTITSGACAGTQRQSDVIRAHPEVEASTTELRFEVVQLARCMAGEVEAGADAVREATDDPDVRRDALLWKANAVPEIHAAALQLDPFVAGMDLWAFLAQMKDFFDTGPGAAAFGEHASLAREALARAEKRVIGVGGRVSSIGDGREPPLIGRWAEAHPLTGFDFQRESVGTKFAYSLRGAPHGGLAALGEAQATMQRLEYRSALLSESMPKLARWNAELAVDDITQLAIIDATLANLNQTLDGAALLVDAAPEMLAVERTAILQGMRDERIAAFESIAQERMLVFEAISREREAATKDISLLMDRQRAAAISEIDALVDNRVRSTVDFLLLRAAQVFGGLLLLAALVYGATRWSRGDNSRAGWSAGHHPARRATDRQHPVY